MSEEFLDDVLAQMRNDAAEDIAYSPNDIIRFAARIERAAKMERILIDSQAGSDAMEAVDRMRREAERRHAARYRVMKGALDRIYRIAEDAFDAPSRDLEASMSSALDAIIGAALLAGGGNALTNRENVSTSGECGDGITMTLEELRKNNAILHDPTVSDLIAVLQRYPQNLKVRADSRDDGWQRDVEIWTKVPECSWEGPTVQIGGICS